MIVVWECLYSPKIHIKYDDDISVRIICNEINLKFAKIECFKWNDVVMKQHKLKPKYNAFPWHGE